MLKLGPFIIVHRGELTDHPDRVDQIRGAMLAGMTSALTPLRDDIAKLRMELAAVRSELPGPALAAATATGSGDQVAAINRDLLRACEDADALIHEIAAGRPMTERERATCATLVDAVATARRAGADPAPRA